MHPQARPLMLNICLVNSPHTRPCGIRFGERTEPVQRSCHVVSAAPSCKSQYTIYMLTVIYCEQNLLFVHPDHLCFDRTTYDNINGPGGPFMFDNWSGRTTYVPGPNISLQPHYGIRTPIVFAWDPYA